MIHHEVVAVLAAGDAKSWVDTNIEWLKSTGTKLLFALVIIGGLVHVVKTKSSTAAIKWAVVIAVFVGIVLSIPSIASMVGPIFH